MKKISLLLFTFILFSFNSVKSYNYNYLTEESQTLLEEKFSPFLSDKVFLRQFLKNLDIIIENENSNRKQTLIEMKLFLWEMIKNYYFKK